jgi:branched-chain amino acid transport system substrate-binding protein
MAQHRKGTTSNELPAISRRAFLGPVTRAAIAAGAMPLFASARVLAAAPPPVKVGLTYPFSGTDAADGINISNGAVLAIEEYNHAAGTRFPQITLEKRDDETPSGADFDPAQTAVNIRSLLSDPNVVAILGPLISSEGKIQEPLLSHGDMAIVTGSATNADLTDPRYFHIYRPAGKTVFFRTAATSDVILPAFANFAAKSQHVKSVFVIDDTSATGVVQATAFQTAAAKLGIKIMGRDSINPQQSDYSSVITKVRGLAPQAVFTAGVLEALSKFAPQAHTQLPGTLFLSNDGILTPQFIKLVGPDAARNWYSVSGAPNIAKLPSAQAFIKNYAARFGQQPEAYAGPTYDAGLVVAAAVRRVVDGRQPLNRHTVRTAIAETNLPNGATGPISFKPNGDRKISVVSIWRAGTTDFDFIASVSA